MAILLKMEGKGDVIGVMILPRLCLRTWAMNNGTRLKAKGLENCV